VLGAHADRQGVGAIGRLDHLVAAGFQYLAAHVPNELLILYEQDGLAAPDVGGYDRVRQYLVDLGIDPRQVNLYNGALADLAVGPDIAARLLYDTVNRGKPRPVPLPVGLVVKKGSNMCF